jgi:hypothetical protein
VPYERLDAARHAYDPSETAVPWAVVLNRASPSAYLRDARQTTFHTLHWLRHLERLGGRRRGGTARTLRRGSLSKAWQLELLTELGVGVPPRG